MRINSIAAWAVLAALALSAGCYAGQLAPTATLTVRIYNYAAVPDTTLIIAEADAIRIYREAGVELTLVGCPTFAADAGRYHACEQVRDTRSPSLKILSQSMASRIPSPSGSLGITLVSDAYVFYHRVLETADSGGMSVSFILGDVMAHEIGHLVLGDRSHSAHGLVKSTLCREDLQRIEQGWNLFTARQAGHLRERLSDQRKPREIEAIGK